MPDYKAPGVYIEEIDKGAKPIEGVSTAIAAFIGWAEKGEVGVPRLVTNWTEFKNMYGDFVPGGYLAHAVYGYFNNGGNLCYVTRLKGDVSNGRNGHVKAALPVAKVRLPSRGSAELPTLEITTSGNEDVVIDVRPNADGVPEEQFTIAILVNGQERGAYANLTLGRSGKGARNVVEALTQEAAYLTVTILELEGSTLAQRAPAVGNYRLVRLTAAEARAADATTAELPDASSMLFVGDADEGSGILGLERHDNVTMVCVPDLMAAYIAGKISESDLKVVHRALVDYCEGSKDRMAILDVPPKADNKSVAMAPDELATWCKANAIDSAFGVMYYPWLQVANPSGGEPVYVPPSGHMAGIWARNDAERGVHKAPANEVVRGAIGLQREVSQRQQMVLNPSPPEGPAVNCIRTMPGRGIRVWGARTLSSNGSWRYVNVRRLFNFVEKSIDNGTQWVVFEPNDFYTWEKVSRDVIAFLTRVWRDGALFGLNQNDAFYVKCDAELNTKEERDVGRMIVEIGIAPVKPAEFVIFRVSQYAGQAA